MSDNSLDLRYFYHDEGSRRSLVRRRARRRINLCTTSTSSAPHLTPIKRTKVPLRISRNDSPGTMQVQIPQRKISCPGKSFSTGPSRKKKKRTPLRDISNQVQEDHSPFDTCFNRHWKLVGPVLVSINTCLNLFSVAPTTTAATVLDMVITAVFGCR